MENNFQKTGKLPRAALLRRMHDNKNVFSLFTKMNKVVFQNCNKSAALSEKPKVLV